MSAKSIPVISLAREDWKTCVALRAAFEEFGFAQVSDHGVSDEVIRELYRLAEIFFALPVSVKRSIKAVAGKEGRGWTPAGEETLDPLTQKVPDQKVSSNV